MQLGSIPPEKPSGVRPSHPPAERANLRAAQGRTRDGSTRPGGRPSTGRPGTVTGRELQGAVFLVLALYASIGLVNLRSELSQLVQHWQTFVEFIAHTMIG